MTKQQEIQIKAVERGEYFGLEVVMGRYNIPTQALIEHIKLLEFDQRRGDDAHSFVVDSFAKQIRALHRLEGIA